MVTRRRFLQATAAAGAWLAWPYRAFESRRIEVISHIPRPWTGAGAGRLEPSPTVWGMGTLRR